MPGVKDRGHGAVEGRDDDAVLGNDANALAQDAGGKGLVGDLLSGDDLALAGLQDLARGAADHGGHGLGGSFLRGSGLLLLGLVFLPDEPGQREGHARAFFSSGLSSFQMNQTSTKATPAAMSSSTRYRGTLFTAGMAGMPVTP